ncbi:hypothetical protein E2C01_068495 [Portunus trituberculatus]|uniref:Uncharacterized protein n=1 Tax=Portunus trituberculatus TaxID=210409 RepID=A0A5B7HWM2_PORTR|nr:hypothetical protein [Portunus trituberculatus]
MLVSKLFPTHCASVFSRRAFPLRHRQ